MAAETVGKLYKISDYDKFELHEHNRDLRKLPTLRASMSQNGFDPGFPLRCVKNGKRLKICSGHRRYHVAKDLGIPVFYVLTDTNVDIFDAETTVVPWNLEDFVRARARSGDGGAEAVLRYHEDTEIPLGSCVPLVAGYLCGARTPIYEMRCGTYKVGDQILATQIADLVRFLRDLGIEYAKTTRFVIALSRALVVPIFDIKTFKERATTNVNLFRIRSSLEEYLYLIEEVYNKHMPKHKQIPLVFEVYRVGAFKQRHPLEKAGHSA